MRHLYQAIKENKVFTYPSDDFIHQVYLTMLANANKRSVKLKLYLGLISYIKEQELK